MRTYRSGYVLSFIAVLFSIGRRLAYYGCLWAFVLVLKIFVFMGLACAQNQTTWTQLQPPSLDSFVSPTATTHTEGRPNGRDDDRIYVAAVASSGTLAYTSTNSPGGWDAWQILGAVGRFDAHTPPLFFRDVDTRTIYLFARGSDNNLYEYQKTWNNNWSSLQQLTNDGPIRGRFSVAFTRRCGTLNIHVMYAGANNTVGYRLFDSWWNQIGPTEQWPNALEGTIATNDVNNEVWAAIRTNYGMLLIDKKTSPWSSPWQNVAGRLAVGNQGVTGEILDVSNIVFFAGAFHVAFTQRYLSGDIFPTDTYHLDHSRFFPGHPDDGFIRRIFDYTPVDNIHPQAELIVHRNKLVMAYNDHQGYVRYTRWDNADPAEPWVPDDASPDIINATRRTKRRPALGNLNRRPQLTGNAWANSNFGNDLFCAITEADPRNVGRIWFINFSRAMNYKDINAQLNCYNYTLTEGCPNQGDPNAPTLIADISQDDRPFFSELGYNFWMLPNWFAGRTGNKAVKNGGVRGCEEGNATGRFNYPCSPHPSCCSDAKYPVIIKPGGRIYICSGIWQTRADDYKRIWEELGHALCGTMGLDDNGNPPVQKNADRSGISLSALQQATNIFGQAVNWGRACQLGNDNIRCRGFTGACCPQNYDVGSRQHSFIYAFYYYVSDGGYLRQLVQDDLNNNVTLLQQKYNWIKDNIFNGVEFAKDGEELYCEAPIGIGQTVCGALSINDCQSPERGNSFYNDRYLFNAAAGQGVAISLASSAFDTHLYLIGPPGSSSVIDDDDGGAGTDSRIPAGGGYYTLPWSGTYTIGVTSHYTNSTGGYTLSLFAQEVCDNEIDDDGDGQVDCDDTDCIGNPACATTSTTSTTTTSTTISTPTTTSTTTTTSSSTTTTTIGNPCQCPAGISNGCISGQVAKKKTGLPLAGKTVKLKRTKPKKPKVKMRTATDTNGCYSFSNLENGTYKVWLKRKDCKGRKRRKKNLVISGGTKINNVNLKCK